MKALLAQIASLVPAPSVVKFNEPMSRHTTLRVGGPADCYVEPASEHALAIVVRFCHDTRTPLFFLGRGSNLLVRDGGVRGVVVCLAQPAFAQIAINGLQLTCGAGAKLKQVAVEARRNGVAGFEFMEGIPGSMGGALRMNAGAMARATFDVVQRVRYMDEKGSIAEVDREELRVEYRRCDFFLNHLALGVVMQGTADDSAQIEKRMSEYSRKRWDSQPAAPSAGCIFKNTTTIPSGRLVDELGLKGFKIGGAAVSDVHGNFIVNEHRATARDILQLIRTIQERALQERAISLETEVQIIGEPGPADDPIITAPQPQYASR